jgi:hypothetical protein
MNALRSYRRMNACVAVALAVLLSSSMGIGFAGLGVVVLNSGLQRNDFSGPIAGALLVCAVPMLLVPDVMLTLSLPVSRHHSASWRAPTPAFAWCAISTRILFPFSITIAPIILGAGVLAWLLNCWLLCREESSQSQNVVQT